MHSSLRKINKSMTFVNIITSLGFIFLLCKVFFNGYTVFSSLYHIGFVVSTTEGNKIVLLLVENEESSGVCSYWFGSPGCVVLLLTDWFQMIHLLLWSTGLMKYSQCFPGSSSLFFTSSVTAGQILICFSEMGRFKHNILNLQSQHVSSWYNPGHTVLRITSLRFDEWIKNRQPNQQTEQSE